MGRHRTDEAAEWYALVPTGIDPRDAGAEKLRVVEAERHARALQDAITFASVAECFIAEHLAQERRGKPGTRRNYLIKAWGARPIREPIGIFRRPGNY